jgi:hypothetical protein
MDLEPLYKARDIHVENQRRYQEAVTRFQGWRLLVTLLVAGMLFRYDYGADHGAPGKRFHDWFAQVFTPISEQVYDKFLWSDFAAPTERARGAISKFVTQKTMDEAMDKIYGPSEPPRIGRVFYYLKKTKYVIDPFLYRNITDALRELEAAKTMPLVKALPAINELLAKYAVSLDHPGLAPYVDYLSHDAKTNKEFAARLGAIAQRSKDAFETDYKDELEAWRAIATVDKNWFNWTYPLWIRLTDTSYTSFLAALADLGDEGRVYRAGLKNDEPFEEAVRRIDHAVKQAEDDRRTKAETAISAGSIAFSIPKRLVLLVYPFLFVLSALMSGMLKLRTRTALIWVAALEKKIARGQPEKDPPLVAPTVSPEVLNAKRTWDYLLGGKRWSWARLFDNNPTLFSEIFYSVLSWIVTGYLALLPWQSVVWGNAASVSARALPALGLLLCTAIVLRVRFRVVAAVLDQTLEDTGERTDAARPDAEKKAA